VQADPADPSQVAWQKLSVVKAGEVPPFVKTPAPPSILETIQVCGLNYKQSLAFALVADRLLQRLAGNQPRDQLLALLLGGPGTGKSRVILALEWFAFQHDASRCLAVTSYAWRAAMHLSTKHNPAYSTCTFYGIDPIRDELFDKPQHQNRRADHLTDVWLAITDEVSFIGQSHLNAINLATAKALTFISEQRAGAQSVRMQQPANYDPNCPLPFGGMDQLFSGDLQQLQAVNTSQLWTQLQNIPKGSSYDANCAGRELFEQFVTVVMLTEQNRMKQDDADGQQLLRYVNVFCNATEAGPSREEVEEVLDAINASVATEADFQAWGDKVVKAVVLRHKDGMELNLKLAQRHAITSEQRMVFWHADDTTSSGARLPAVVQAAVDALPATKTKHMPGISYFFPGMHYIFTDNKQPDTGRLRNNGCVAEALLLDPREPQDDTSKPVRWQTTLTWGTPATRSAPPAHPAASPSPSAPARPPSSSCCPSLSPSTACPAPTSPSSAAT
jgi:hypothetical protein